MEHLKMHSVNKVAENIDKIAALFPNCVTETTDENGKVKRALDFDMLKQELSEYVVEGLEERYQFTWPDKKKAMLAANAPINKTLRPCREESVDFDTTENLYIEGDNLEVLKLLQETYLGKVKMIYIDPPYNTGNDFVYNDDFAQSAEEYMANSGQYDEEGNRLVANTESNGRFHTDWLNMMYPRLKLAKDLLSDDGVIFISIDDNEVENLKKICAEVWGDVNLSIPFIWLLPRGINAGLVARAHEYVLCVTKNNLFTQPFKRLSSEIEYSIERCNKKIDERHPESIILFKEGIRYEGDDQVIEGIIPGSEKITLIDPLIFKDNKLSKPARVAAGWTMKNMIIKWMQGEEVRDSKGQPIVEFFFRSNGRLYSKKEMQTLSIKSVLKDIPDSQIARRQLEELLGSQDIFPYPKPYELAGIFTRLVTDKDSIILDFFSGSATTAHAVMQLNAEDGGHRKFIMVQLPEECDEKSEAFKAGYKNICEIGKERIRRAGQKIKDENPLTTQDLDIGFRVLKLDTSNMEDVYYTPGELVNGQIDLFQDNVKADRTPEDLLFQVMLDLGTPLSSKIVKKEIAGKKVFDVADGHIIACFDTEITDDVITAIAKEHPSYFVMRDSSMAGDSVAINFEQIFATYSPNTERRVL